MNQNLLKAALWYQQNGFSVIPVRNNKKPFVKWEKYQTEKADKGQIQAWWKKWPTANIGIVTGAISGIMVIDADSQGGIDAVNEFLSDSLALPISNTPKGGQHFYFKHRPGLSNGVRVITDTDFRTDGGYVLAPPSNNGNGKSYTWIPNLKINEVTPATMPEFLFDALKQASPAMRTCALSSARNKDKVQSHTNENALSSTMCISTDVDSDNNRQQPSTSVNIGFYKGQRDTTLFHLANHLVKSGMPEESIRFYLNYFGAHCKPPFPEKETEIKIQSALNRAKNRDKGLTQEIRDLIMTTSGNITTTFIYNCQHLTTREEKKKAGVVLSRLVKEGLLERTGNRAGEYRRIEDDCDAIDWQNASTDIVNVSLPFELDDMIEIPPGSIILFAGSQDAGKSATLMNIALDNMNNWGVHYYSSELNASAFKMRMSKFPNMVPEQMKLSFYQRSQNFADVIKTGKNDLNIIDYLEIHGEFYKVSEYLARIHEKLGQGICVIALQKDPNALYGRGGSFTQEKPILSIALDYGKATISKFKGEFKGENPRGKQYHFKLVNGCVFKKVLGWHKPIKKAKGEK